MAASSLRYDLSATDSWYPYFSDDPSSPGIMNILVPLILQKADIQALPRSLPPKRIAFDLQQGRLDFDLSSPKWFENGKIPPGYVLTLPLLNIRENLIFLPENTRRWPTISAVYGKKVGTVKGYMYHDASRFTRVDFASEKALIIALAEGRIDVAISGDLPAVYWSNRLKIPIQLGAIHSDGALHMRLRVERQQCVEALNQAIEHLKRSGQLSKLLAKYQYSLF